MDSLVLGGGKGEFVWASLREKPLALFYGKRRINQVDAYLFAKRGKKRREGTPAILS